MQELLLMIESVEIMRWIFLIFLVLGIVLQLLLPRRQERKDIGKKIILFLDRSRSIKERRQDLTRELALYDPILAKSIDDIFENNEKDTCPYAGERHTEECLYCKEKHSKLMSEMNKMKPKVEAFRKSWVFRW